MSKEKVVYALMMTPAVLSMVRADTTNKLNRRRGTKQGTFFLTITQDTYGVVYEYTFEYSASKIGLRGLHLYLNISRASLDPRHVSDYIMLTEVIMLYIT